MERTDLERARIRRSRTAQVSVDEFGRRAFRISDLASARRAVEEIVLQGEGLQRTVKTHIRAFSLIEAN